MRNLSEKLKKMSTNTKRWILLFVGIVSIILSVLIAVFWSDSLILKPFFYGLYIGGTMIFIFGGQFLEVRPRSFAIVLTFIITIISFGIQGAVSDGGELGPPIGIAAMFILARIARGLLESREVGKKD